MDVFIISFFVYLLVALAIGIGILFRGKAMHAGCGGLPTSKSCQFKSTCSGQCQREKP